ncbi:hypothetical protein DH86_00001238, partial [Scytalidium sp. 3C]
RENKEPQANPQKMIHKSPLPSVSIPEQNLLDLLFPRSTQTLSSEPLWVDASDTSNYLSLHTAKQWIKRFGCGLQKRGIGKGDIVLLFTPNHVFVPVGYLGTIASGAGCSGANPSFTEYDLLKTGLAGAKKAGVPKENVFLFSHTPQQSIDG